MCRILPRALQGLSAWPQRAGARIPIAACFNYAVLFLQFPSAHPVFISLDDVYVWWGYSFTVIILHSGVYSNVRMSFWPALLISAVVRAEAYNTAFHLFHHLCCAGPTSACLIFSTWTALLWLQPASHSLMPPCAQPCCQTGPNWTSCCS